MLAVHCSWGPVMWKRVPVTWGGGEGGGEAEREGRNALLDGLWLISGSQILLRAVGFLLPAVPYHLVSHPSQEKF